MSNRHYIVDIFAHNIIKYAGNPIAVFTNSVNIDTQEMQSIAKETNYSATTFITSPQKIMAVIKSEYSRQIGKYPLLAILL